MRKLIVVSGQQERGSAEGQLLETRGSQVVIFVNWWLLDGRSDQLDGV
jgi:hypothetical protein